MYSPYYYWDWTILLLIPGMILGLIAQARVKSAYRKFSAVATRMNLTGAEAARRIMNAGGVCDVPVQMISGELTDNYDPRNKVLNLSSGVYASTSIAAVGVAAHEAGHAIQHADAYAPLALRNTIVPAVSLASRAVFPILLIGLFIGSQTMLNAAILVYALTVVFQLLTLPVELNASRRALAALENEGMLYQDEVPGARRVLRAAASTYVVAALSSILQLLRLFLLYGNRRRRD